MSNPETILGTVAEPPGNTGKGRTSRMLSGAFATAISKGVVLIVNAISLPIMVRYLGAEAFGVWTTITALLAMLLLLDLGVANSMTNLISEAFAQDDQESASCLRIYRSGNHGLILYTLGCNCVVDLAQVALGFLSFICRLRVKLQRSLMPLSEPWRCFWLGSPLVSRLKFLEVIKSYESRAYSPRSGASAISPRLSCWFYLRAGLVALVIASSAAFVGANLLLFDLDVFFS